MNRTILKQLNSDFKVDKSLACIFYVRVFGFPVMTDYVDGDLRLGVKILCYDIEESMDVAN